VREETGRPGPWPWRLVWFLGAVRAVVAVYSVTAELAKRAFCRL